MTSILTNVSALAALQTLRAINSNLADTQSRVSSGRRIAVAADNAAYWSISTTMRSDNLAISAVSDALGLGSAKVEVAYAGLNSIIDVLMEFKAKLVASKEGGVDKAKIQVELDQFKEQVQSIATSASFSGVNWLNTDIDDIYDNDINKASVASSFARGTAGVAVKTMDIHLSDVALFNSTGGGLLQPDARDLKSIGGMRYNVLEWDGEEWVETWEPRFGTGVRASSSFTFSGPLTFDDAGDQIAFDVTVDADNPDDGIDPPYNPGHTTSIVIDRTTIDAVDASWNGVISTNTQYAAVLNYALNQANSGAFVSANYSKLTASGTWVHDPEAMSISTSQNRSLGLDGSYIEVSNFSSTVGSGGLGDVSKFGSRGSKMTLTFDEFQVYKDGDDPDGVEVSFGFYVNDSSTKTYSFDRTNVNELLGKDTGKIETADEMVMVLQSLMGADWPDVIIETTSASSVTLKLAETSDRRSGSDTRIGFTGINVSIEPLPTIDFLNIDIAQNPQKVGSYITYIEAVTGRIVDGAATLGALQKRIDMQSDFAAKLMDATEEGVARLVDADMNEESTRLKALQTQEQLALQALQIANSEPQIVMQLFR
ncbi:flagellin [Sinorhizobium kostiense]|uniref:Flagellin n=1 Tax=Sinorhizobium kostiense TaxID=76747 RepID=A0ABS4QXA0_9HYPH|nr:flagellin [Sinorhizobium kostiense]